MEDYQKDYLRKLVPRIGALEAALEALDTPDEDAVTSAQRISHTLRGSGKTYGFPGITEFAAAVEESSIDQLKPRLKELIDHLRSLSSEASSAHEKILVVDDSDEMRLILGAILEKQGYEVLKAETASQARTLLQENSVSLIILDLILPDTDGRNFLMEIKENFQTATVPTVILSAKTSPQIKAECYALGADNYFEKPIDPGLLSTHVAATIQSSKKMQRESKVDSLTGLLNRAAFLEMYQNVVIYTKQNKLNLSLGVVDLDNFKSVNEKYGYSVGDEVLKYATRILVKSLHESDMIGRWGGEEFTILFPDTDPLNSKQALTKVLELLKESPFKIAGRNETLNVTFSAGIIDVDVNLSLDENFSTADRLLYLAKESGRSKVVTMDEQIETRQKRILLAEDDDLTAEFIIHRLDRSGFIVVHYLHGDEAYAAAKEESFDLVITDVKMPGMDGFELVQRVRQDSSNQNTPMIMLTSMGNENDIARGLRLGANDYMLKPFSPTELLARVHRLLK
ncbi:MAG: response regulator [Candidatus Marinimicrobia bacterium]|nr:response regulator [Candidatus Neomarinimicrobiota bacterium]